VPAQKKADKTSGSAPVLEPGIRQSWRPLPRALGENENVVYVPELLATCKVSYTNARSQVDETRDFGLALEMGPREKAPDWSHAIEIAADDLDLGGEAELSAEYADCPAALCKTGNYAQWQKQLATHIRTEMPLILYKSDAHRLTSSAGESERDFRIRLQHLANEKRDVEVGKLRKRYESKLNALEKRLLTAQQAVERESEQASGSKLNVALSVGTAVLGALLGRKKVSVTTASRAGTAARRAGDMRKQVGDVKRAEERVAKIQAEIEALTADFDAEVEAMEDMYDAQTEELREIPVRARSGNIQIDFLGIGWRPEIETRA
jgi:uncharacterized protein YlxW (UPF0749 family)